MRKYKWSVIILAAALASPVACFGSGAYNARIPKPPPKSEGRRGADIDHAKYDLGQKVFNGKAATATGDAATQRPRLEALQAKLPAKTAKDKNLTTWAGKLSDAQLDALEYYVNHRYPTKR